MGPGRARTGPNVSEARQYRQILRTNPSTPRHRIRCNGAAAAAIVPDPNLSPLNVPKRSPKTQVKTAKAPRSMTRSKVKLVGQIGLGIMGGAFAKHLRQ